MAKASFHLNPMKSFSAQQGRENERRGWTEKSYQDKNKSTGNHYDWSRHQLNFEINESGKVMPLCSNPIPINQRLANRLEALGYKKYKSGTATNDPICCVDIVVGGDHDRMCEIAFGKDQVVDFQKTGSNGHTYRTKDIESWALDTYQFACKRWGKENIIGMEVHLDETTPHAHLLMVPVANRKQRGRIAPGQERKSVAQVSYGGVFGDKLWQREKSYAQVHTDYHNEVGVKWGLERGTYSHDLSDDERKERRHKNKQILEAERIAKQKVEKLNKQNEELNKQIEKRKAEEKAKIAVVKAQVLNLFGKGDLPKLKGEIQKLQSEKEELKKKLNYHISQKEAILKRGEYQGKNYQWMSDKQFIISFLKAQGWNPSESEEKQLLNKSLNDIMTVFRDLHAQRINRLNQIIIKNGYQINDLKSELEGREQDVKELVMLAYPDDENMHHKYSLSPNDANRLFILSKEEERARKLEAERQRQMSASQPRALYLDEVLRDEYKMLLNGAELSEELLKEGIKMYASGILPDYANVPGSGGGGGGSNEDNKRKKDEDDVTWAKRCARALANKSAQQAPRRSRRR